MTRFDAATPAERQKLFAEAVAAHRERASPYLTVEAERTDDGGPGETAGETAVTEPGEATAAEPDGAAGGEPVAGGPGPDEEAAGGETGATPPPWMQFADGVVNLDCTEAELDRLKDLLDEFPAFKITELTRPDAAEGVNARVSAKADARRVGQFLDRAFRSVYGLPEDYRAWVVEV